MKRLIYQVCLGQQAKSKLYKRCIESVRTYCDHHGIDHIVQTQPILKIKPDIFSTNRSEDSYKKHGGFLPIYEKENAFDLLDDYDQIAIVDADIFVREFSPNIFDDIHPKKAFGVVIERDMPISESYARKILNYSRMQYGALHGKIDFMPNELGYEFGNMGMIVLNCKNFKPYLKGQGARAFINRMEFKDFVDGQGPWKWSTDQTLLNYFIKKYNVPVDRMHWKWNGLYGSNTKIEDCNFVHFFLKDHLPDRGEDVETLLASI